MSEFRLTVSSFCVGSFARAAPRRWHPPRALPRTSFATTKPRSYCNYIYLQYWEWQHPVKAKFHPRVGFFARAAPRRSRVWLPIILQCIMP